MKWKSYKLKNLHLKDYDKRKRVKFLLWPRLCEDGYYRWLERVNVEETWDWENSFLSGKTIYKWRHPIYTPLTHEQKFNTGLDKFLGKD